MQTTRFTLPSGLALAVLLTLLVGSVGADDRTLEGTWDVTLQFPEETCDRCGCPGNTPDIPLPTLNTFLKHGGMLWSGSALTVGPGQGSWERLGHNHFVARFKLFIFALTIDAGFPKPSGIGKCKKGKSRAKRVFRNMSDEPDDAP